MSICAMRAYRLSRHHVPCIVASAAPYFLSGSTAKGRLRMKPYGLSPPPRYQSEFSMDREEIKINSAY